MIISVTNLSLMDCSSNKYPKECLIVHCWFQMTEQTQYIA